MTKLIVTLVVIAGLLFAADRVAAVKAGDEIANRAQVEANLATPPDVSIGGIPFLTQAISGKYDDVTITAEGLERSGLRISEVKAHLHGVHVPLSDAINGSLQDAPVDEIDARAFLSYHDINGYLASSHASGLVVSAGPGGEVHIAASSALGNLQGNGRISVGSSALRIDAGQGLVVTLPFDHLPFELRAASAHAVSTGITVSATASNVDLRAP
jgi:hypothetical protein